MQVIIIIGESWGTWHWSGKWGGIDKDLQTRCVSPYLSPNHITPGCTPNCISCCLHCRHKHWKWWVFKVKGSKGEQIQQSFLTGGEKRLQDEKKLLGVPQHQDLPGESEVFMATVNVVLDFLCFIFSFSKYSLKAFWALDPQASVYFLFRAQLFLHL